VGQKKKSSLSTAYQLANIHMFDTGEVKIAFIIARKKIM